MSVTKVTGMMQTGTKGGDIPSAGTLVIDTDGDYFDISGSTGITAMTVAAGRIFTLQFDGVVILTHSSTLYLNGAVNFTTEAFDHLTFIAVAANDVRQIGAGLKDGGSPSRSTRALEYNQAILAFKIASANQLAKFSMVDQVIDEYQDATGIDDGPSNNHLAGGATTAKYYEGGATVVPTTSSVGSAVSGGTVDEDYTYYKWLSGSTGTFTTNTTQDYEYLVVAGGGGGGGSDYAGGGGAGGYLIGTGFSIASGSPSITGITVGASGAGGTTGASGAQGGNSVFGTGGGTVKTSVGGGYGVPQGGTPSAGGSGGGSANQSAVAGGAGTSGPPVQGFAGGRGTVGYLAGTGGGGGGSSAVGVTPSGVDVLGHGGAGTTNDITGASVIYAAGGGGASNAASSGGGLGGSSGVGGRGGGTDGSPAAGATNTGSGGGGASNAGNGGTTGGAGAAGIIVIRRLTSVTTSGANLTLQSQATTAESAPTTADLVILIEDAIAGASGIAAINTDIKAKVSRDGSAFSGYVTLVDEGNWGTDKRIFVARNIDISGITSGVAMKYKIETFNQSAGVKETRIHATSLAWA